MKIGLLLDGPKLARWQADALATLAAEAEFILYICKAPAPAKRHARHALYYLLNLFTVRNRLTQGVDLPADIKVVGKHVFAAPCEGAWQSLPDDLVETIRGEGPDVLVKFGMGLLKVPPPEQLAVPILSYHHGDPARFRGRPAGFYELLEGEPVLGQIVQVLSNRLDAGRIVAAAETRIVRHSYRATLVEAYRHSPLLLRTAIRNALAGAAWEPAQWGQVYRLPGNSTVARFAAARIDDWLERMIYGLFREKKWGVATAPAPDPLTIEGVSARLAQEMQVIPTPPGYRFLADPFQHPEEGLLVEAMSDRSARGQILHVTGGGSRRLSGRGGHFSYPAVSQSAAGMCVVPEVSEWSAALAYPLEAASFGQPFELRLPGRPRLLDPTPFRDGNCVYLFGNVAAEGPSVLRLWVADALDDEFVEHPSSPIRISPNGARMAGAPIRTAGGLVRVGQDLRRAYGDGISLFRVSRLDPDSYAEEPVGEFRFSDRRGPHTLNLARGEMAFDYYHDVFSLLAGVRRYRERRAARRTGD